MLVGIARPVHDTNDLGMRDGGDLRRRQLAELLRPVLELMLLPAGVELEILWTCFALILLHSVPRVDEGLYELRADVPLLPIGALRLGLILPPHLLGKSVVAGP